MQWWTLPLSIRGMRRVTILRRGVAIFQGTVMPDATYELTIGDKVFHGQIEAYSLLVQKHKPVIKLSPELLKDKYRYLSPGLELYKKVGKKRNRVMTKAAKRYNAQFQAVLNRERRITETDPDGIH